MAHGLDQSVNESQKKYQGAKGFLTCGYINVETYDKTDEACAIVTGVNAHHGMLSAEVKAVAVATDKLGVRIGMKGEEALAIFR